MTGTGRTPNWRRRALLLALAMVSALVVVPVGWNDSSAQDTTSLTFLYHGAVTGKVAPCG